MVRKTRKNKISNAEKIITIGHQTTRFIIIKNYSKISNAEKNIDFVKMVLQMLFFLFSMIFSVFNHFVN